jgi:putative PIN family toxin of toxin-antitoxin system
LRFVLDTNVLVSALWSPNGPPARVVEAVLAGVVESAVDDRTIEEAREVLSRPRLARRLDPVRVAAVLDAFFAVSINAGTVGVYSEPMIDPDDRPFLEIALATGAILVTGNVRHFPMNAGVRVLTPAQAERLLLATG